MLKTSKTIPAVDVSRTHDSARAETAQEIERRAYALAGVAGVLCSLVEHALNQDLGESAIQNLQNGLRDLEERINEHRHAIINLAFHGQAEEPAEVRR